MVETESALLHGLIGFVMQSEHGKTNISDEAGDEELPMCAR